MCVFCFQEELDLVKAKLEKVEKERNELKFLNDKLEAKVWNLFKLYINF